MIMRSISSTQRAFFMSSSCLSATTLYPQAGHDGRENMVGFRSESLPKPKDAVLRYAVLDMKAVFSSDCYWNYVFETPA